jgi:hypothetical protein
VDRYHGDRLAENLLLDDRDGLAVVLDPTGCPVAQRAHSGDPVRVAILES